MKQRIRNARCDSSGRALAGSQRQIQEYVNSHSGSLERAIAAALSIPSSIRWVSPLKSDLYREYQDSAFLNALGLHESQRELGAFWPKGGPVWDALGVVGDKTDGVLMLEAKSHVPEISGSGCCAKSAHSIQKIDSSLSATKRWLGVSAERDWKGNYYQTANRLAHLYFFREVLHRNAWLVNVYFIDDPRSRTSQSEWDAGVAEVKRSLGIGKVPFYADVYLPAIC